MLRDASVERDDTYDDDVVSSTHAGGNRGLLEAGVDRHHVGVKSVHEHRVVGSAVSGEVVGDGLTGASVGDVACERRELCPGDRVVADRAVADVRRDERVCFTAVIKIELCSQ